MLYIYILISLGPGSIFFSQGKEVARRQFKIQKTFSKKLKQKQLQKTFLIIVSGYNLNGLPWPVNYSCMHLSLSWILIH